MSSKRYTKEFKEEAVKQVVERGYSGTEVAKRLGISSHSLYKWVGGTRKHKALKEEKDLLAENARLKAELDFLLHVPFRFESEGATILRADEGSLAALNGVVHAPKPDNVVALEHAPAKGRRLVASGA